VTQADQARLDARELQALVIIGVEIDTKAPR
jgi:hypothetical protein